MRPILMIITSVCIALSGCGTMAEIRMADGRILEGKIRGGDLDAIYLGESHVRVPRKDIVDIDHPGNGAAITGLSEVLRWGKSQPGNPNQNPNQGQGRFQVIDFSWFSWVS